MIQSMRFSNPLIAAGLIAIGVVSGITVDRYWLGEGDAHTALPAGETTLEHARKHLDPDYVCPMHAEIVSKEAGSCPVCGMDLVKRETAAIIDTATDGLPEVVVPPEFIHNFGVRTATVTRGPVSRRIMALGRVSRMPLPRVTDVPPGLQGKVLSVGDKAIGDAVDKGELLYSVDAPEWRRLQHAYLEALDDEEDQTRAKQLRQRLQSLGMKAASLTRLVDSGQVEQTLDVHAPTGGTIIEVGAGQGEEVDAGTKVITLGGMNRIPVIVSLFEGQGAWVDRGQRITVRVPTMPGIEYEGQVDRTDREINFSTRTLPVYVGFSTPDPRLRYGMLVEVTIHAADRENVLQIPRDALIRTGEGSRVIVAKGDGRFQPVAVVPGLESGDVIEVISGLEEGQEIVVSGQFLIDSESSLMADFQRMENGGR
jgi:Cu(I)/Ag(I) efflux system membrane fusion protein